MNCPRAPKVPVVSKMDPDAASVLQIAISAPRSTRDVTLIADKLIKQKLENCNGVGQVQIQGGANREIHIVVNPERLRAYNLTVTDVFNCAAKSEYGDARRKPKGRREDFTIRTSGKIKDPADFNSVVIASRNGYTVKVSDIGYAEDSSEEPTTAVRLNGVSAVQLAISKQSGTNTVEVVRGRQRASGADPGNSAPKMSTCRSSTTSRFLLKAAINKSAIISSKEACSPAIVLYFFLANWRTTLIAAIAIPVSIISAFSLMAILNYTMNQITMLVSHSDGGSRGRRRHYCAGEYLSVHGREGMGAFDAAERGTKEIGLAVLATTVSLLAVFLPVGFMGGHGGKILECLSDLPAPAPLWFRCWYPLL